MCPAKRGALHAGTGPRRFRTCGPSGPSTRIRFDGDGLSGLGIEDCHRATARRGWSSAHRNCRLVAGPCCIPGVIRFALDRGRYLLQARARDRVGERRFRWCRVLVQDPPEVVSDTLGWAHILVSHVDLPDISSLVPTGKSPEAFPGCVPEHGDQACSRRQVWESTRPSNAQSAWWR